MEQIILIVHLLVALAITGLIMLQQGKGADMGASFGAGASQTLLGSGGSANVLTKSTAWLVALFFATSFGLALLATDKTRAVSDDIGLQLPAAAQQAPAEQAREPAAQSDDLPQVNDEIPQAESVGQPPAEGGDVPEL